MTVAFWVPGLTFLECHSVADLFSYWAAGLIKLRPPAVAGLAVHRFLLMTSWPKSLFFDADAGIFLTGATCTVSHPRFVPRET